MPTNFTDYENQTYRVSVPDYMTNRGDASSFKTNRVKFRKKHIDSLVILELDMNGYEHLCRHLEYMSREEHINSIDKILRRGGVTFGEGYEVSVESINSSTHETCLRYTAVLRQKSYYYLDITGRSDAATFSELSQRIAVSFQEK